MRTGVQPGSFDPPTLAHLAIAHAALRHHRLDRVIWTVSRHPLGKDDGRTDVDDRLTVLHSAIADHRWLAAEATDARLVADIADGYDVVIMGADKWHQLHDPTFYGEPGTESAAAMDPVKNRRFDGGGTVSDRNARHHATDLRVGLAFSASRIVGAFIAHRSSPDSA